MTQNTAIKYLEEKYQVNYILAMGLVWSLQKRKKKINNQDLDEVLKK